MYSDKAIKAIMESHKPKIVENTGYRLTAAQINDKIKNLEKKAKADPEHAADFEKEIADLKAILNGKSDIKPKDNKLVKESQYLDMMARLSKSNCGK